MRTLGRAPQRSNCCTGQSPEARGRSVLRLRLARGSCGIEVAKTSDRVLSDLMLPSWDEVLWPFQHDAWDSVRHAQPPRSGTSHGGMGCVDRSSSSSLKKEAKVFSGLVRFGTSISAGKVKACALIGLHMMARRILGGRQWLLCFVKQLE